jgi:CHAT domain-containing protein
MSNEPRAGKGIDPEMLAAYIDKRLPPDERAAVEAQLATDPHSYELLVELVAAQEELGEDTLGEDASKVPNVPEVPRVPMGQGAVVPLVSASAAAGRFGGTAPKLANDSRASEGGPKVRVQRWVLAGGVLAAAAALVLVVRMQPDLLQRLRGGDAVDPQLAKLVAAVGEERYIEARLTGGFKYGPLRSVTRGTTDLSQQNLALLAAAGELQKRAQEDPAAGNLHAWGIGQLLLGQYEDAVSTLERVVAAHPEDSLALSDLAAALLARGQAVGRAEDFAAAVSLTTKAVSLPSPPIEAFFNRALALESMGLRDPAIEAWTDVIARDSRSPWNAEATTRLNALKGRVSKLAQPEWPAIRVGLEAGTITDAQLRTSGTMYARESREYLEDVLFPLWGRAVIESRVADASRLFESIRRLAQARAGLGDRLALGGWEVASRARGGTLQQVAEAHVAYGEARARFESADPVGAAPLFRRATELFTATASPFELWSRNFEASVSYFRGEYPIAIAEALRLLATLDRQPYPLVRARTHWLGGLVSVIRGDLSRALRDYDAAILGYAEMRETGHEAFLHAARAENRELVGDLDGAWSDRIAALAMMHEVDNVRRRHTILLGTALFALRRGFPAVTGEVLDAAMPGATASGNAALVAELHVYRARALAALGKNGDARDALREANAHIAGVPPSLSSRLKAEILLTQADVSSSDGEDARALITEARDFFDSVGAEYRVPAVERARARVAGRSGDLDTARDAYHAALAGSRRQRSRLEQQRRLSYTDESWDLVDEVVEFELSKGTSAVSALALADEYRADSPAKIRVPALAPGQALLRYVALPSRVIATWTTSEGTSSAEVTVSREDLSARIDGFVSALRGGDTAGARKQGNLLWRQLVMPLISADTDTIFIVPDGPIHRLPFAALTDDAGHNLTESLALVLVPSATMMRAELPGRFQGKAAIFVSPDVAGTEQGLPILRHARAEVAELSAMVAGATVLQGDAATPSAFLKQAADFDIIHFAGHAQANPLYPANSWMQFAPSDGDSGRVFAHQIGQLALRRPLVVLSACETSRGRTSRTEGPMSLAREFLKAGAFAVVASAWPVDDAFARVMSVAFYRALDQGLSPARALQRAQQQAINALEVPASTWASYAVFGGPSAVLSSHTFRGN